MVVMVSVFVAQVYLALQVVIFGLLAVGMVFKLKRRIQLHGQLMLAAVALNIASFLAVMAPAWDSVGEGGIRGLSTVGIVHVSLGGLAMLSSLWVVGTWLLPLLSTRPMKARCYGAWNKRLMWIVLGLWLASLIMGFVLYLMINTTLLSNFPVFAQGDFVFFNNLGVKLW